MDILDNARNLRGKALEEFARTLFDGDGKSLCSVISGLIDFGTQSDCEQIAAILALAPISDGAGGDYYAARYGSSIDKRYLDLFLNLCASAGIPERDYIKVLLAVGNAGRDTELYRWNAAVDAYLTRRATENFSLVDSYIDAYDRKYTKYYILVRIDANAALSSLVNKLLYKKNLDKTAIRDALMDHSELKDPLMAMYLKSNARERAAILRLLLLYKNDVTVREFLTEVVANDTSKTVKRVLPKTTKRAKIKDAPAFFERVMAEGREFTYTEWQEILKDERCAAVADRIFFCIRRTDVTDIYVYNAGKFLNMSDVPQDFDGDQPIGVMHPLDVPSDSSILNLYIAQPFEQIARRVFSPVRGERYSSSVLSGTIISRSEFDDNVRKLGFEYCGKRTRSEPDTVMFSVGKYVIGVECDLPGSSDTACCGKLCYYSADSVVRLNRTSYLSSADPMAVGDLPRREFSELTLAAHRLFCR